MFFSRLVSPSEDLTCFPVEDAVLLTLGVESPPFLFQISYSTLEAKKSAVCNTEMIEDFCLDDSLCEKKYASLALSNTPS